MGWATFWVIFSKQYLITLTSRVELDIPMLQNTEQYPIQ
jgi:hypothetical protein